ncbi:MAG: class III signal peptide-containing protein [archaeon]
MFDKKGQGTIEYLVIIAIVVVIALVVVGILLQILDQGSAIPTESAKIAWKSAEPWAIVDWSVGSDGNLTVVIQNNSHETLDFVAFNLTGSDINDTSATVPPGAPITRTINVTTKTTSGQYSYDKDSNMYIEYNTSNINGKKQFGAADIIGTAG